MAAVGDAVEFVNHHPTGVIAILVDAAQIQQHVKTERQFGEATNFLDTFCGVNLHRDFIAKRRKQGDQFAESDLELLSEFEGSGRIGHETRGFDWNSNG